MKRILIVAHRGGAVGTPENTLAAFASAVALGADMIELDVHLSKDGIPVVIHDHTVDRTTDGSGEVAGYTVDELQRFDAGSGERIPTLQEVVDLVGDAVPITIEVKAPAALDATIELIRANPGLRWNAVSSYPDVLRSLHAAFPGAEIATTTMGSREASQMLLNAIDRIGIDLDGDLADRIRKDAAAFDLDEVLDRAAALPASIISCHFSSIDADLVARVHARGFQLGAWTVNEPAEAARLMDLGVDLLTTDDPATMIALRDERLASV